ncbi:La-related protein [Drosera capensis]
MVLAAAAAGDGELFEFKPLSIFITVMVSSAVIVVVFVVSDGGGIQFMQNFHLVEFYFSDVNLATTDHLIKFIHKNPEGYVPISVVASFKKIKALISTDSQLAAVLRNSKKLVVSDDGRKVKRLHPLTASDMEELQARIVIAENLPEDHCHQKLMKIFSSVGSVKSIRTCQPQPLNNVGPAASRPSKQDHMLYSNKLHAFVEYDSVELAEKAVAELNEEGNWRNGLRVRLLLKRTSKSMLAQGTKVVKEGEGTFEDGTPISEQGQDEKQAEDSSRQSDFHSHENLGEEQVVEKEGGQRKNRNRGRGARGRGRGRGRGHQHQYNHGGAHIGTLGNNSSITEPASGIIKHHHPPGPRMPDGTRGFSMGRGKPLLVNTA